MTLHWVYWVFNCALPGQVAHHTPSLANAKHWVSVKPQLGQCWDIIRKRS